MVAVALHSPHSSPRTQHTDSIDRHQQAASGLATKICWLNIILVILTIILVGIGILTYLQLIKPAKKPLYTLTPGSLTLPICASYSCPFYS